MQPYKHIHKYKASLIYNLVSFGTHIQPQMYIHTYINHSTRQAYNKNIHILTELYTHTHAHTNNYEQTVIFFHSKQYTPSMLSVLIRHIKSEI